MEKVIKTINGFVVELVPGLACKECLFQETHKGVRSCATTENDCLDVHNGGWQMVEDPAVLMELNEDPIY